jgi:hypothetical protein
VILGAVFVAVSLLVDKVTIRLLSDTAKSGECPEIQLGAGIPLLLIGIGTGVMLYAMARARKIMAGLEVEIGKLDSAFSGLNHPRGLSGAKLVWRFMALVALGGLICGMFFLIGIRWAVIPALVVAVTPWTVLCFYAWT